MKQTLYLFFILLLFTSCKADHSKAPDSVKIVPASEVTKVSYSEVVIKPVGDQLKFDTEAFTVKTGATVKLVLDNVATLEAMQHNVVILAVDADADAIGLAGMKAGADKQYIPEDSGVLFYTPLAKAGESVEVEFTAPAPGEYTFICTFPGHYTVMKGVMTVEA